MNRTSSNQLELRCVRDLTTLSHCIIREKEKERCKSASPIRKSCHYTLVIFIATFPQEKSRRKRSVAFVKLARAATQRARGFSAVLQFSPSVSGAKAANRAPILHTVVRAYVCVCACKPYAVVCGMHASNARGGFTVLAGGARGPRGRVVSPRSSRQKSLDPRPRRLRVPINVATESYFTPRLRERVHPNETFGQVNSRGRGSAAVSETRANCSHSLSLFPSRRYLPTEAMLHLVRKLA